MYVAIRAVLPLYDSARATSIAMPFAESHAQDGDGAEPQVLIASLSHTSLSRVLIASLYRFVSTFFVFNICCAPSQQKIYIYICTYI